MQYVCRLGTPEGRVIEEVRDARDASALREEVEKQGYHLFEAKPRGTFAKLQLGLGGRGKRRLHPRVLLIFNQEFAALLRAGLPVMQALQLLRDRQRDPVFQEILTEVYKRVQGGEGLSEAIESFGDVFPPLYAQSLRAGERSGELEQVVRRFVRYQALVLETRKKVISSLVYPAALIGLSLLLIAVMMVYVLPKFTDFFRALDVQLPLLTRITMGMALFVKGHVSQILITVAVLTFFWVRFRRSEAGRLATSRLQLKIPLLGKVFHSMALSEFSRSMATLLAGGIPVVSSLGTSIKAISNEYMRRELQPMVAGVREGQSLADSLEETGVGSDLVIDMIKVGEETGSLDTMLSDASDFLDEEVETSMERILSLLEPAMMILMGGIVAALLVSVYLPIFSLLGQVQS